MIYDYFIVGAGLAGICFSEVALQENKHFFVFDKGLSSSEVAPGVFNAVILKRFTLSLSAKKQLLLLNEFYPKIEKRLGVSLIHHLPTYRRLASFEEQNNFIVASDKPLFSDFLSSDIVDKKYKHIQAPFGFGQMKQTGYVEVKKLLTSYKKYLQENNALSEEEFDFSKLQSFESYLEYDGKKAKNIIFAEGFGMKQNPYFPDLPLDGTKGEILIIKAEDLDLDVMLKSDIFILPLGNGVFKVGATYNWDDKTAEPTESGKQELTDLLKNTIDCKFEIIDHLAGIRPTVKDRRPLVGKHPEYKNMYLLNGLGTRGVMLGPYLAQNLFNAIEFDLPLNDEINVNRFYKKNK